MQRQLPQHDGLLFPAYAGVILITHILQFGSVPFPRIRGGDPQFVNFWPEQSYFSPHTRG